MKTNLVTVIHHSADFDGIFCREIARMFLPDAELIGWNFGDQPMNPPGGRIYILDLPCDEPFGLKFPAGKAPEKAEGFDNLIWIDHHRSSIASHPRNIPGYRIDGVAACRLAWQWFTAWKRYGNQGANDIAWFNGHYPMPAKQDFVDRKVSEPLAVRLAGEYDIWDKRDPNAEVFQHGLRAQELDSEMWACLLGETTYKGMHMYPLVDTLLVRGQYLQFARANEYAEVIQAQGFDIQFEGLTFLACCSHECDIRSHLFTAGIKPHHDALLGFTYTGKVWRVSMYHAPGKEHHDLSKIAVKHGGGGHRGACGFAVEKLPFL